MAVLWFRDQVRTALLQVQLSSPKGKPRFTLGRSEFSSASVSTLFAHERQFRGNAGSPAIASQRRSSARWKRAYAELHCQSSPSSTKFARTGFRSTIRLGLMCRPFGLLDHESFGSGGLPTPAEDVSTFRALIGGRLWRTFISGGSTVAIERCS